MTITIVLTTAYLCAAPSAFANQTGKGLEMMDTPPDPEKAVASEYAGLKARGTIEAFELFIARHPDHPLADDARKNLKRLRGN
ncbi:hypothetical protein [Pararhizobium sp.]|uniref:hypothetical protein n=1 Tax=Pararhizobium sp. TaxID=1977563 RepID=UPI002D7EB322|nr:hypothetical protein [Pararhizobium sp.]